MIAVFTFSPSIDWFDNRQFHAFHINVNCKFIWNRWEFVAVAGKFVDKNEQRSKKREKRSARLLLTDDNLFVAAKINKHTYNTHISIYCMCRGRQISWFQACEYTGIIEETAKTAKWVMRSLHLCVRGCGCHDHNKNNNNNNDESKKKQQISKISVNECGLRAVQHDVAYGGRACISFIITSVRWGWKKTYNVECVRCVNALDLCCNEGIPNKTKTKRLDMRCLS